MLETIIQITFMISLLLLGAGISRFDLTKPITKKNIDEYNRSITPKENRLLIIGAILFVSSIAIGSPIVIH